MTIPASQIVSVNPGVLSSGGNPLALNGVILSQNLLLPTGKVQSFDGAQSVSEFFGPSSLEYSVAQTYFLGYDNSTIKPNNIFFAPYAAAARSAWLQSGSLAGMTLAQLNAIPAGRLLATVDGNVFESASINLSTASSFSNAASTISSAFSGSGAPTCDWNPINSTFNLNSTTTGTGSTITAAQGTSGTGSACTSSGTTLTIGGTVTGTFSVGDVVEGTDSTNTIPPNTTITAILTGSGGAGTYTISAAASPGNLTSCAVTGFDSEGTIAIDLKLTAGSGAILSQGQAVDTPASAMANVIANTQNWVAFMTLFEPTLSNKENFAIWTNAQNQRYAYLAWDTDSNAIVNGNTTCFGYVVDQAEYQAIMPLYNTVYLAAFVLGAIASINFSQTNGRITAAFKSQSGFIPTVTNEQIGSNLLANGYSFYGAYATANTNFNFLYNGQISGEWQWLDLFVDQVYLNSQFQLALMELLTNVGSIPYNQAGYSLIRSAMNDPIAAAINFGSIRAGVVLSSAQIAEINNAAGVNAAAIIQQQGYYLQILDPGSVVRGNRGTPVINFWYTDGGAVQMISLASIDVI